jgi:AcrR family transcriptional regulator
MAAARATKAKAAPEPARRRTPLTPEEIAAAALRIADEKGVEGISTRRLGQELGCSHTAVYLYFPTRDDLLKAVFDLAMTNAAHGVSREGGWEDRARAVCMAMRRTLMAHPVCYDLARRFPGRGVGLWVDDLNSIAADAGYDGDQAVAVARLLSQVAADLTSSTAVRRDWEGFDNFESLARPGEHDLIVQQARFDDDAIFITVVEFIIDGLRRGAPLPAPTISAGRSKTPGKAGA